MKTLTLLVALFSVMGCNDNCRDTDVVDYYRTETTEFYTITEPVYKKVCE